MNIFRWIGSLWEKRYFNKGDRVELANGSKGSIVMVFQEIKTDRVVGCMVALDDGHFVSIPTAENKGKKYNPFLRLVK